MIMPVDLALAMDGKHSTSPLVWRWEKVKGRHGIGNKGNFESDQSKSKACSYILIDREYNPLFVTMDTSCKLNFRRDSMLSLRANNGLVDIQTTVSTLNQAVPSSPTTSPQQSHH